MTQRDEGHNYRDSKNKAQAYERKQKEIRDNAIKYFDEWLDNCPCEYTITKPSMNIKDNKINIEFDFIKPKDLA